MDTLHWLVTIATRIMATTSAGTLIKLRPFCFWVMVRPARSPSTLLKIYRSRAIFICCSPVNDEKFSSDLSKCMNRRGAKTSSVVSRGSLPTQRSAWG